MNPMVPYLVCPVIAYLAGSIPFGLVIVRWKAGSDIRQAGSGNIGTTNVRRLAGNGSALLTLICDLLKGMLPTMGAMIVVGAPPYWLPAITALAAILGHMYPVYLQCKPSGKGVATALGVFLAVAPVAVLIAFLVFIPVVWKFRRISAASLIAMMVLPPAIWFTTHDLALLACGLVTMVLVIYRHQDNLKRLASGTEPPFDGNRA